MTRPKSLRESLPGLRHTLWALAPYLRRQRWVAVGSVIALLSGVGLKLLEPWPLKWVFDHVLAMKGRVGKSGADFLEGYDADTVLIITVTAIIVITAIRAFAEYLCAVGFAIVGNRVLTQLRNNLYSHLQRLSLSYHTKARGGDLTVRVIGDVNMLKDVASTALLPLAASILVLVGMAILMLWLEWRLALIAIVAVPMYWLTTGGLTRRIRESSRQQRAREGEMAATVAESLAAVKDMQALSLEPAFAKHFADRSEQCKKVGVKTARLSAALERRVDVLGAIATAAVLFVGVRMVLNGSLSPGDLLVFLAYLKRSFNPLQDLAKYTARLAKAAAAGERVLDVLSRQPDVTDSPHARPARAFRGDVRFDNVEFAYESNQLVLSGVSFTVPAGSSLALVGPSGIGKSTLLNLLMRLYDPTAGRVTIDDCDIRDFTIASLRSQISVVLQDGLLFAASVRDNIAQSASDATDAEIEGAARLANAHDFIEQLPRKYETIIGERGATLSHGQRQRLAIARAAIRKTPILILDEPTTGLDETNEREVIAALDRLARDRTTFLVTHDLRLAAKADAIVYFEGGGIVELGSHHELLRRQGRYAAMYQMQNGIEVAHAIAS